MIDAARDTVNVLYSCTPSLEIPARKRSLELSYIEPGSEGGGRRRRSLYQNILMIRVMAIGPVIASWRNVHQNNLNIRKLESIAFG